MSSVFFENTRPFRRVSAAVAALFMVTPSDVVAKTVHSGFPISYTLSPGLRSGRLSSVYVTMRFKGERVGKSVVELPDRFGGASGLWKYIDVITVSGAKVLSRDNGILILRHLPGREVTLRYHVASAYDAPPKASAGNPYAGVIIQPQWFSAHGEMIFASVRGRTQASARFAWTGWPASWKAVSDADGAPSSYKVSDLQTATLLAGARVELLSKASPNNYLRLPALGSWSFTSSELAATIERVVSAQRAEFGEAPTNFTVTLVPLEVDGFSAMGGTSRGRGFALYATSDTTLAELLRMIAHENIHSWIPNATGTMPESDPARLYWITEGFSDFFMGRTLVKSGIWTPNSYTSWINGQLAKYAHSSVRNAPNDAVARHFWDNDAAGDMPYLRGMLFAFLVSHDLSTRGENIEVLIKGMVHRWREAPDTAKTDLLSNFMQSTRGLGLDARNMIERYITNGETILLPSDALGACADIDNVPDYSFVLGFKPESIQFGLVEGVDSRENAYAAGLRDGMRLIRRLSGSDGDAMSEMAYEVSDRGRRYVIRWAPRSLQPVNVQRVRWRHEAVAASCMP